MTRGIRTGVGTVGSKLITVAHLEEESEYRPLRSHGIPMRRESLGLVGLEDRQLLIEIDTEEVVMQASRTGSEKVSEGEKMWMAGFNRDDEKRKCSLEDKNWSCYSKGSRKGKLSTVIRE